MFQILLTLIIGGLVYGVTRFLYWYFTTARRIIRMTDHLQAPGRHFLWGTLHLSPGMMTEKRLIWLRDMGKRFGPVYKLWDGPFWPRVVICHPEPMRDILRTSEPKGLSVVDYGIPKKLFGNGLVLSRGDIWRRNRHLLTPAFHFNMLKEYAVVMNKTTDELLAIIEEESLSEQSFDVFAPLGLFALDTILKCAFSFEGNVQRDGDSKANRIVKIIEEATELMFHIYVRPYLWPDIICNLTSPGRKFNRLVAEYSQFTQNVIQRRKDEMRRAEKAHEVRDLMDMMLLARDEDGKGMTDGEVEAEVKTFVFAGHDTISSALSWTMYALTKHPEHQDLCRKEVREILEGRTTDKITNSDLHKLEYLTIVIKETMRLYTTAPIMARELTQDIQVGEHMLPKGCSIRLVIDAVHHHPDVWPDPDRFDPSRFRPENIAGHSPYDFIPFSAGPRNCIGQNFAMNMMKIVMARILYRFEFEHDVSKPAVPCPGVVLKAENGMWLKFKRLVQ